MDLLILCCFGGVPFIQFPSSSSKQQQPLDRIRHQWDPTDWVAVDVTGLENKFLKLKKIPFKRFSFIYNKQFLFLFLLLFFIKSFIEKYIAFRYINN